ncbi:MAG: T9SS type A sorting domain-containing protein [Salibacteraceae bacterium]
MSFRRTTLLFLFVLILSLSSFAQKSKQYAPRGAIWGYTYYDGFCWPVGCHGGWVDEVIGDTVIHNSLFSVITRSNYYDTRHINDETIYRGIVNDSLIEINGNEEQFLLDFSWDSDDTVITLLTTPSLNIDTFAHTFLRSDTIISNRDTIQLIKPVLLWFSTTGHFVKHEPTIYRNIGSQSHLFYEPPYYIIHSKGPPRLICYEELDGFKLPPSKTSSCRKSVESYIALGTDNIELSHPYFVRTKDSKLILSNRQNDEHEKGGLIIRNIQGQVVLLKNNYGLGSEVDISNLNSGIYFLEFNFSKSQKATIKFIISE